MPLDVGPQSSPLGVPLPPVVLSVAKPTSPATPASNSAQPDPLDAFAQRCLRLLALPGPMPTTIRLADEIAALLGGDARVAIGARRGSAPCRLLALSGHQPLDPQTEYAQCLEAALHETTAIAADPGATAPAPLEMRLWRLGDEPTIATRSLSRLASLSNATGVACWPVLSDNAPSGALLVLTSAEALADPTLLGRMRHVAPLLAGLIPLLAQSHRRGLSGDLAERWHQFTARKTMYLTLLGLLLGVLTLAPLPGWISCTCLLEPHTRRYIAAPFAAKLERSLVQPGDVVAEHQVLAELDEQPLRIELATRQAEYDEAIKKRDAALAARKASDAQIGELEAAQIKGKMRDLERRLAQLSIRSSTAGVVVRGDLKRSEGMPLDPGQSLFEIAPLTPMIAEVSVREDEFRLVQVGQRATVRLDAFPGRQWIGTIARVHPRAELRDDQSVFVAEIALNDESLELRPGMRGTVRIDHDWQPLAWTWFRRPVTKFARWLGW